MSVVYVLERFSYDFNNEIVVIFRHPPDVEDIISATQLKDVDMIKDLIKYNNVSIDDSSWSLTEWSLW